MFCSRPFTQFYVDEHGDAWQCCPGWVRKKMGSILGSSVEEVWRGEAAEEVRRSVVDGSFRHCGGCPFLPDQFLRDHLEPGTAREIDLGRIGSVVLSYDPACNLRCPSCRLAPRLNDDLGRIHAAVLSSGVLCLARNVSLSDVGEPLASQPLLELLRDLPGAALDLTVSLHTNGLLLTPEAWAGLGRSRSKIISVTVSVDATTPETYAANRGGDFDLLLRNLAWMSGQSFVLDLNFVYQANNFREMPDFVRFADRFRVRYVRFTYLSNKGTYSADDFRERNVRRADHPLHGELLSVLAHPLLADRVRVHVTS